MRQKIILLASLPLTKALSLVNFQDITFSSIALKCQLTYDSQIPSCTVTDFGDAGCSVDCSASLTSVGKSVSKACSDVDVNSNTLLGIIKDGGILQALCPTMQATTKSQKPSSTPFEASSQSTSAASVTIPTTSPGVVIITTSSTSKPAAQSTFSTTSRKPTSQISTSQTIESITSSSGTTVGSTETTAAAVTTTSLLSEGGSPGGGITSTTSTDDVATSSTKSASATKKTQSQSDSGGGGGGSPFDISSNNGSGLHGASLLAFVVAACASIILGR